MNTVLAIVGNGRSRVTAPHANQFYDVWGFNNHVLYAGKRFTAAFEMHPDALTSDRYTDEYKDWLKQPHDFPIYTHGHMADVPASHPYPLDSIQHAFGRNVFTGGKETRDWFSSSFPYALALGIYKGYPRIELFGVDLYEDSYQKYRDHVFFWLGVASQLGIVVTVPENSGLIKPSLYPFY